MAKNLLHIEANTPEEVGQAVESVQDKSGARYAALSIAGPKVIIQQFNLPHSALKGLKRALQLEAAGLLSLAPDDIALDYQITESNKEKIKGFFLAAPLTLIEEYCAAVSLANLIPVSMSVHILRLLNAFLANDASLKSQSFSLLYFNKRHKIHLVVFTNGNCELIREILFDNADEARQGIVSSLRYALGKGAGKDRRQVYCAGDTENNKALILEIEGECNCKAQLVEPLDIESTFDKNYIGINLLKAESMPLDLRQKVSLVLSCVIIAALFFCAWPVNKLKKTEALKKNLSASLKAGDYERAISLQEKIKKIKP